MKSCEDCQGGQNGGVRELSDSTGTKVTYDCPLESEPPVYNFGPIKNDEEEKAS